MQPINFFPDWADALREYQTTRNPAVRPEVRKGCILASNISWREEEADLLTTFVVDLYGVNLTQARTFGKLLYSRDDGYVCP